MAFACEPKDANPEFVSEREDCVDCPNGVELLFAAVDVIFPG